MNSFKCRFRIVLAASLLVFAALPLAVTRADESPRAKLLKTAIEEGRYADAESGARVLLEETTKAHGPESKEAAETLLILVTALWKGGKASQAETLDLAERGVALAEGIYGAENPGYSDYLNRLGDVHFARHDLDLAQSAWQRVLEIREKAFGPEHLKVAVALNNFGILLNVREEHEEAARILERAVSIYEKRNAVELADFTLALGNLAETRKLLSDYEGAKHLFERVIEIEERHRGPDHPSLASFLNLYGHLLLRMGDYNGAVPRLERALEIQETSLGPDHPDIAGSLLNLGHVALRLGEMQEARDYYVRSLAINENALGPDHFRVAFSLSGLGDALMRDGEFSAAIEHQERALGLMESNLGPDSPRVAQMILKIGQNARMMGDYAAARLRHEQGLRILEKALGPDHPDLRFGLAYLADTFTQLGKYDSAESLYERALEIVEKALGPEHPHASLLLNSIGILRTHAGRFAEALPPLERSLAIWEKNFGPDHPESGSFYDNLAHAYEGLGQFEEAIRFAERSMQIWDKHYEGEIHDAAFTLILMGRLERRMGHLEKADEFSRHGFEILSRNLGPEHPLVAWSMNNLARIHWDTGDLAAALDTSMNAERIAREHFVRLARSLAEREALGFEGFLTTGLNMAVSVLAKRSRERMPPGSVERVWDELVRARGMVLDEMATRHRISLADQDPATAVLVRNLRTARDRLASMVVRGPDSEHPEGYAERVSAAQSEKERHERALAASSHEFRETLSRRAIGFEDVRTALPPGSALLAYIRFDQLPTHSPEAGIKPDPGESIPSYLALLLKSGEAHPVVVPLGGADDVDERILRWQEAVGSEPAGLPLAGSGSESTYRSAGSLLRELIWDPVARKLEGFGTIFVVPDGAINLVNLATLPIGRRGYLVESQILHYLSTERDLIRTGRSSTPGSGLLALGGPDFDASRESIASSAPGRDSSIAGETDQIARIGTDTPYRSPAPACGDFASLQFAPLPASRTEVRDISSVWLESPKSADENRGDVMLLIGPGANEAAFKRLAPGRLILHLATHGFFLDDRCESILGNARARGRDELVAPNSDYPLPGDNPLLLSGLALAGANSLRETRGAPDEEDGILTAEEIASLDLASVDWAVLSACETGVGTIQPGEGVLGLRRAFEMAGVGTLIMSLWRVQDDASREWMRNLYEGPREGRSTAEAVHEASLRMIERRRSDGKSTHPFYWGAFIAAGDWK